MRIQGPQIATSVPNRDILISKQISVMLGIAAFTFLTAIGAFIRIPLPFTPVPFTMQVFFVLLGALLLGPRYGTVSQAAYIVLGIAGMPMFTLMGVGIAHLTGPTGGYIVGFLAAQPVIGYIIGNNDSQKENILRITSALVAGLAVIFFFGCLHLKLVTGTGIREVVMMGLVPFIPGAILKAAAAGAIYITFRKRNRSLGWHW